MKSAKQWAGGLVVAALICSGCGSKKRKLDEAIFYEGPEFTLKLTRYYLNMPFHYTGEVFSVQCRSVHTADEPEGPRQDPGWVVVSTGGAAGSSSAREVADYEKAKYLVMDDRTLVRTGMGLSVSFDACGTFRAWQPTSLPAELIDPVDKPDYCAPKGGADCRHYDFLGDREPRFTEVRTDPDGGVSFFAHSKSFRNSGVVRVESDDYGRTWTASGG